MSADNLIANEANHFDKINLSDHEDDEWGPSVSFLNQKLGGFADNNESEADIDETFLRPSSERAFGDDEHTLHEFEDTALMNESTPALSNKLSSGSLSSGNSTIGRSPSPSSDSEETDHLATSAPSNPPEKAANSPFSLSFATFPPPPKNEVLRSSFTLQTPSTSQERQKLFVNSRFSDEFEDVDAELEANLTMNSPTIMPSMPDTYSIGQNGRKRIDEFELDEEDQHFTEVLEMGPGYGGWIRNFGGMIRNWVLCSW